VSGQVITTGTNPLATDTQYTAIQRFQTAMETYLRHCNHGVFDDPKHFLKHDSDGEMMVLGWIAGEVLVQAMGNTLWLKDRASFAASLFDQRRYLIDDLVIGDYGGDCSAASAYRGAVCHCNQGGRTVYMKRFVKNFRAEKIFDGDLQLDPRECYSVKKKLKSKLIEVAVVMEDSSLSQSTFSDVFIGIGAALKDYDLATLLRSFAFENIESTMADAHVALTRTAQDSLVHVVAGLVTEAMLDVPNVTFIDP
ncbi:putative receptor-type adenylate cyclase, partial [Trypanosoma theileri]